MYEKNGVEYSTRTECIDWRYSAAILGLVKFYEYGKKMAYKYLKIYRYISGRTCGEVYG